MTEANAEIKSFEDFANSKYEINFNKHQECFKDYLRYLKSNKIDESSVDLPNKGKIDLTFKKLADIRRMNGMGQLSRESTITLGEKE